MSKYPVKDYAQYENWNLALHVLDGTFSHVNMVKMRPVLENQSKDVSGSVLDYMDFFCLSFIKTDHYGTAFVSQIEEK